VTTIILAAGEQRTIETPGQFVFFEAGSAGLYVGALFPADAGHDLKGAESGILLDPRDQARWEHRFTGLRLINQGAASQTITLKISDAQFFPKQDGGLVTIAGQAAPLQVETAGSQGVSLDGQTVVVQTEENAPDGIVSAAPLTPGIGGGATIPANPERIAITLRCDAANDGGAMMVNGVPLYATDPAMTIKTTAAVTVVGGDADDLIYYFETERS